MKNRMLLLISCFVILFSACAEKELFKTINTEFDDKMSVHAYLSGNLHGKYLHCKITVENVSGGAYFFDEKILELPQNIENDLKPVIKQNGLRVYKLFNELIIINDDEIDNIPIDYNLTSFLSEASYNGVKTHVVSAGISALCHTKKFEYISRFLPILEYIDKEHSINSIIEMWAEGNFTEEELVINKNYSKEEMICWCKNYLLNRQSDKKQVNL